MRIIMLSLILSTTACSTVSKDTYREALTEIDRLERELINRTRERDAAREDYEIDIVRAFHRDTIDRKYPYTGQPLTQDRQTTDEQLDYYGSALSDSGQLLELYTKGGK